MGKGSSLAGLILQALLSAFFFSVLWTTYPTTALHQTFFLTVTAMVSAYFVRKIIESLIRRR